jgi:glycosyltransferase involved in cell wall biosynthesis
MLRIYLPALQVAPGLTGVGVYSLELIRAMSRLPRREELVIGAPHPEYFAELEELDGIELVPLKLPASGSMGRMLATHTVVPAEAQRLGANLVLGPNFIAPLWGRFECAVMVHDLTFARHPETTTRAKRVYYQLMVRRSLRRASVVFVSTQTVGNELLEFAPETAGKIWRTPEGVSPGYQENGDREEVAASGLTGPERKDFLFVGTLEPRKNLARLLRAHGNLCRGLPDFPALRIVGGRGWEDEGIVRALHEHPDPSRLIRLGYCEPVRLRAEYDSALALVFPSVYEGFGLPVLEAMARGCPVLTSRDIATEEVAGGAALLVDPLDTGDIERALARLAKDRSLRLRLAHAGVRRSAEFSWEICAEETLKGLHTLLGVGEGIPQGGT